MKAAVFSSQQTKSKSPLLIKETPQPKLKEGYVLLRVRACGVCRTDLHIVEGDLPPLRQELIPGHQIVGEVVEGASAEMPPGSRVGVSWMGGTDGDCTYCRRGWENLCDHPTFTGYTVDGGYAAFALARADFVFPLPGTLDDMHAAPLLCAGIIGFRSLRVAGTQHGERVGLFGFGASASLTIAVLQSWGCEVYVSTRGEAHRKLAASLGATWVGNENEKPPVELDRAVTFAPSGEVVVSALASLHKGGVVAINAIHLDRMPAFDYDKLLWGERQIRSVANMTREDARDFLKIAAEIGIRPNVKLFSLEQANEGNYPLTTSKGIWYDSFTMRVKQSIPKHLRYTVKDFNREFPNDSACLEYVKEQRFPGGVTQCAKCEAERKHHRVTGRTAYACDHCGNHIYPLAGTIFEKSTTSLRLWFYAAYLMGSTRCGISAKQIQRETGVTYKTAWRIFKQIRTLLAEENDTQLEGPTVEVDEMYFGGVQKFGLGRKLRGDTNKIPVIGIVQRRGKVIAKVIPDVTEETLSAMIKKHVTPGSTVYTDEHQSYRRVRFLRDEQGNALNYRHRTIRHKGGVYVRGDIHTNSVEGLWSLIKRGIGGVYHQVSPKYLQRYLDEYCFRYNRRHDGNLQFKSVLARISERAV